MAEDESEDSSGLDILTPAQKASREQTAQRIAAELAHSEASSMAAEDDSAQPGESDANEGAAVYERFKNRRAMKRKQAGKTAGARKRAKVKRETPAAQTQMPKSTPRKWGDESDNDDMTEEIPDYIVKRRRKLEEEVKRVGNAGLTLPPNYDAVHIEGDGRLQFLQEKPAFNIMKPCAQYRDISLPNSLGVTLGIIPAPIAQWLKAYQVKGAAFLHNLIAEQKGGILGDDMGLGKTIQVIAALTAAFGKTGDERDTKRMRIMRSDDVNRWYPRVLIICPGVLMENWKHELQTWGWWHVETFHGSGQDKQNALGAAEAGFLEIMITTYTTYKLNKSAINSVAWDCVIADECHMFKERKAEVTQAMNDVNALCRIGLTGTAIQNKYEELWTLLNWTRPGEIGPLSVWKSAVSDPLKLGQAHDATSAQLSKARRTAKNLVQNLLPRFFLRRMKTLIADQLPKKSDRVVFCPLTSYQAEAYENFLNGDVVQHIKASGEPCHCGSGKKQGVCCERFLPGTDQSWQGSVFPVINVLRNLSNHVGLLIPHSTDPDRQERELKNLESALPEDWKRLYSQRESILALGDRKLCGKWAILKKLLKFWYDADDKVLVFSHSVRLLKLLRVLFQSTSYNVSYLDGSMSYGERSETVHAYNADPSKFVFLISTRAGGVGLNITSANKVVVVDPNWNPSFDLQAQDRAYRIGQTRDVEVFRLVSAGTIEEIVYARQIYKQQQANIGYTASLERRYFKGVQDDRLKKGEIFGLHNMLAYQSDNIVLRDIVNKTNIAESRAGVDVVDIAVDECNEEDEQNGSKTDEDAAMKKLAELISKGEASSIDKWPDGGPKTHKSDAIQGILAGAGVQYTHNNAEVIGSSKVETRLSKRAEETGKDINERVFAQHHSQSQHSQSQLMQMDDARCSESSDEEGKEDVGKQRRGQATTKYRPSEEVRRRQFCSMAGEFGFESVTDFALIVESWTQAERREFLERFYERVGQGKVQVGGKGGGRKVKDEADEK